MSSVPLGFNRAMWLRVTAAPPLGESVVKSPPMRILPSGWTTTTRTAPLAFGSKPSSADCPRTAAANKTNGITVRVKSPLVFFMENTQLVRMHFVSQLWRRLYALYPDRKLSVA
jgi:hypothetical protein